MFRTKVFHQVGIWWTCLNFCRASFTYFSSNRSRNRLTSTTTDTCDGWNAGQTLCYAKLDEDELDASMIPDNKKVSIDEDKLNDSVQSMKKKAMKLRTEADLLNQRLTKKKMDDLNLVIKNKSDVQLDQTRNDLSTFAKTITRNNTVETNLNNKKSDTNNPHSSTTTRKEFRIAKLTPQELHENANNFSRLPMAVQSFIVKSSGIDVRNNSGPREIVAALHKNDVKLLSDSLLYERCKHYFRLFGTYNVQRQLDVLKDRTIFYTQIYPKSVRRSYVASKLDSKKAHQFYRDIILDKCNNYFKDSSIPELYPGGYYIIKGRNNMRNGDELISVLDNALANSPLASYINCFYVENVIYDEVEDAIELDTFAEGGDFKSQLSEEDIAPVLLITGSNLSPPRTVRNFLLTAFGIASSAYFATSVFASNEIMLQQMDTRLLSGLTSPDKDMSVMISSVLVASALPQVAHDISHLITAAKYKFQATIPTLLPFPFTGVMGSVTKLKSSPMNRNQLIDYALSGPLTGIVLSTALLVVGFLISETADATTFASFPSLSRTMLQQSLLSSSIISAFIGSNTLFLPDPTSEIVQLHPFSIAGVIGILTNSLSLLPLGNSDGGRVLQCLVGRKTARNIVFFTTGVVFIAGYKSIIILSYLIYHYVLQDELEIPLRNEVDEVTTPRKTLAILSLILGIIGCIPLAMF